MQIKPVVSQGPSLPELPRDLVIEILARTDLHTFRSCRHAVAEFRLLQLYSQMSSQRAVEHAVEDGSLELIQFLMSKPAFSASAFLEQAIKIGELELVDWVAGLLALS